MPALAQRKGLLGVVLAPLAWLERTRGWKRGALLAVYLAIAGIAALFAWREAKLRGLPDVGDPFSVEPFVEASRVPDDQNAFLLYEKASMALKPMPAGSGLPLGGAGGWADITPETREWVEANGEALALWLEGAGKPDASSGPIEAMYLTPWEPRNLPDLTTLIALGLLESSRREEAGDLAGAWECYAAALRSQRHEARHAGLRQFTNATFMTTLGSAQLTNFMNNPGVDAPLLHRILDDLTAIQSLETSESDAWKVEYVALLSMLEHPEELARNADAQMDSTGTPGVIRQADRAWSRRIDRFVRYEPERSRRILRLIFANRMAQLDKTPLQRPQAVPVPGGSFSLYKPTASDPPAARAMPPDVIISWIETTQTLQSALTLLAETPPALFREIDSIPILRMNVAERLYVLEHGHAPERNSDLVEAGYLDRLPDDYGDDGPIDEPGPDEPLPDGD